MSKIILTFVMVLSAASISLAECPFKNMNRNSQTRLDNQSTVYGFSKQNNNTNVPNNLQPEVVGK